MSSGAPMSAAEGEAYHRALAQISCAASLVDAKLIASTALRAWRTNGRGVPCDFCEGRGFHEQHDNRPFIDEYVKVPCGDCGGTGRVQS